MGLKYELTKGTSKLAVSAGYGVAVGSSWEKIDHVIDELRHALTEPGGRLNIKMLSCQYGDPHVKDKTVSRPSYL